MPTPVGGVAAATGAAVNGDLEAREVGDDRTCSDGSSADLGVNSDVEQIEGEKSLEDDPWEKELDAVGATSFVANGDKPPSAKAVSPKPMAKQDLQSEPQPVPQPQHQSEPPPETAAEPTSSSAVGGDGVVDWEKEIDDL